MDKEYQRVILKRMILSSFAQELREKKKDGHSHNSKVVSNSLCDSLFHTNDFLAAKVVLSRERQEEERPFLPSLVRRAGDYKRCVEFPPGRWSVSTAYIRGLFQNSTKWSQACVHARIRVRGCGCMCTDCDSLNIARACMRTCVRACSLHRVL